MTTLVQRPGTAPSSGGAPGRRAGSVPLLVLGCLLAAFVSGTVWRPAGRAWQQLYDVGLYSGVYAACAAVCWTAARRLPDQRRAWRVVAAALLVSATGSVLYSTVVARQDPEPSPSVAALHGTFAQSIGGSTAAVVTDLAYPVADVLLLTAVVSAAAVLGLKVDRALALVAAGLGFTLAADVVYLQLLAHDTYGEGGWLDLTWLLGVAATALGAFLARPAAQRRAAPMTVGRRVVAVPAAAALGSLVLLGAGWDVRMPLVAAVLAVACVLTAMARVGLTFAEVRALTGARQLALTDELTGLPNRRHLLQRADCAVADGGRPVALLLLDLDGFKEVNDGLGHWAGDELLRQIGPRLAGALEGEHLLARLGGDEFAVLAVGLDAGAAVACAQQLHARLAEPFTVDGVRVHAAVSIGVATAPEPAATVTELLRCADVAMYAAKSSRAGVHAYQQHSDGRTGDRLRLMEEVRTALDAGQLLVHLQPQVRLGDGRVVGAEALVRGEHPARGLLAPGDFLPAVEQAGLLRPLAAVALDLALAAAARCWGSGTPVPVSVNLSAADVADPDLAGKVAAALARHGLPPRALVLELVEDTLVKDPVRARTVLEEVRRLGVGVSIDDYGTGYSSLAYLRGLPADELELDRAFTADLDTDVRAAAIVEHAVALAHALGLRLVAEGVEDAATAQRLAGLGCDVAQGYHLGRPMPEADFTTWLDRSGPAAALAVHAATD